MSSRKGEKYLNGKSTPPQAGDEAVGAWSRERLIRMDADFVERMQRAIASGKEKPPEDPTRAA